MPVDRYLGKPNEACKKVGFPIELLHRLAGLSGNNLWNTKEVVFERDNAYCITTVDFLFINGDRDRYRCTDLLLETHEAFSIDSIKLQAKTICKPDVWVELDTMRALV